MAARSRRKGKRGEYLVRDLLRRFGFESRRGIQAAGEPDQVHSIPGVHIEVKNDERLSIWAMLAQAERDASSYHDGGKPPEPVVLFKRNGTRIYAAMTAEHYLRRERRWQIVEEFIQLITDEIEGEAIHEAT